MIDDTDVPLLFAFVVVVAIFAAPSLRTIVEMATTSAAIGLTARGAYALLRRAGDSCRRLLRATP